MSSLAASRADGYYFPPDHDPARQGRGGGGVGRGSSSSGGGGVVRFEMVFSCKCVACGEHIAQGRRFNAGKRAAGNYLNTPLWHFAMGCPSCGRELVVGTDPEHRGYRAVSGLQLCASSAAVAAAEAEARAAEGARRERQADPMARLEHRRDVAVAVAEHETELHRLRAQSERRFKDDYQANAALRARNRVMRGTEAAQDREAAQLGLPFRLADAQSAALAKAVEEAAADGPLPAASRGGPPGAGPRQLLQALERQLVKRRRREAAAASPVPAPAALAALEGGVAVLARRRRRQPGAAAAVSDSD
jgi:coiled-coil domain-containing protein 130